MNGWDRFATAWRLDHGPCARLKFLWMPHDTQLGRLLVRARKCTMSKGLSWSCPARNHQVCSARNHQVCSVELGPGELSSNGILGNRISWGLLVSRLIFQGKTVVFMGYQIFQGTPPLTGSPTALWKNYCRETHLLTSHPVGCCLCWVTSSLVSSTHS